MGVVYESGLIKGVRLDAPPDVMRLHGELYAHLGHQHQGVTLQPFATAPCEGNLTLNNVMKSYIECPYLKLNCQSSLLVS